jgi:nucleoside-diphosphate-sugar epimerase
MTNIGDRIIGVDDRILVTGAAGFIGARVVECLLRNGYKDVHCLVRSARNAERLELMRQSHDNGATLEVVKGNLLSNDDCLRITENVSVIYHLAPEHGGDHTEPSASGPPLRLPEAICEYKFILGLFEPQQTPEAVT